MLVGHIERETSQDGRATMLIPTALVPDPPRLMAVGPLMEASAREGVCIVADGLPGPDGFAGGYMSREDAS